MTFPVEQTGLTVQPLDWDTDNFGFRVGALWNFAADDSLLHASLKEARSEGYKLVYVSLPTDKELAPAILEQFGGELAVRRRQYGRSLVSPDTAVLPNVTVTSQPVGPATERLRELVLTAGQFSRFAQDPRFPRPLFEKLYSVWIDRSCRRELAQNVLVARNGSEKIAGLITTVASEGVGHIGLIAVDEQAHGGGFGTALMQSAEAWMLEQGATRSEVVTQATNTVACRFFEHGGYEIEREFHIYHFWL